MKTFIYSDYPEDNEIIKAYIERFNQYTNQELVDAYNRESKMGIVGVRRQALFLLALNHAFLNRFKNSPSLNEDLDQVKSLRINDKITLVKDNWEFIK